MEEGRRALGLAAGRRLVTRAAVAHEEPDEVDGRLEAGVVPFGNLHCRHRDVLHPKQSHGQRRSATASRAGSGGGEGMIFQPEAHFFFSVILVVLCVCYNLSPSLYLLLPSHHATALG